MLTREHVAKTEAALGVRLPAAYVGLLLKRNGAHIDLEGDSWRMLPCLDETDRRSIEKSGDDIVRATRWARESVGFPAGAVVIGAAETAERLILLAEPGGTCGVAVYRWSVGEAEPTRVADHVFELWGA